MDTGWYPTDIYPVLWLYMDIGLYCILQIYILYFSYIYTGWYPYNNTSNHLRKGEPHIHDTIGGNYVPWNNSI